MRRLLATAFVLALAVGGWTVLAGASGDETSDKPEYKVELDNAFGLIEGGDLKVAGVRAGKITDLQLDRATRRAIVSFRVDQTGFGSLRRDVHCNVRPQSLIGEYFVDCLPGTAREELEPGTTIPVRQTSGTVPPDLVQNVLRKPERQRLSLIINSLGAGVAGNGANLNAAIRRAVPALTETDRVLAKLAGQRRTLTELTKNGDTVLRELAGNKDDVGRFVEEARDTARASAERRGDIAEGFRRLPGFLQELRPTMRDLGSVADAQGAALSDLDRSSQELTRFFVNLGPFADVSRTAVRSLGSTARTGRQAVKAVTPTVSQLNRFAKGTPELGRNLAIVLEHLDDPAHEIQDDPRAPKQTGRPAPGGYTGLEAFLQYIFDNSLAINIFDANQHILGIAPFPGGECADFADIARAKEVAKSGAKCSAALGPNQPGLNLADPTNPNSFGRKTGPAADEPARARRATRLPDVMPGSGLPATPRDQLPVAKQSAGPRPDEQTQGRLLDYLLGS